MSHLILRGVLEHVLQATELNLNSIDVFPGLLHQVGDALADMLGTHGYRLVDKYIDGRDVVVSLYCVSSGHQLRPIAMTLVGMPGQGGEGLAILLRDGGHNRMKYPFGDPIRFAGVWYRRLDQFVTSLDLINFAIEPYESEADCGPFAWPEVA